MTVQPYPEYKDSGLDWLDVVPESWTVEPLRNLSGFTTGWTPPTGNADSYDGDFLWANISDLSSKFLGSTAKRLSAEAVASNRIPVSPRGSLLFSFKLTIGSVSIADTDMYTNEAIATFRPSDRLLVEYAYFSLPFFVVRNATENIYGAPMLNARLMRSARVAVPPVEEQRQIADYLDAQTAKIDALIGKQEQLIETLAERRQAVISHAVTKGLDANALMKGSGDPWIESIPASWELRRLKYLAEVDNSGVWGEDAGVLDIDVKIATTAQISVDGTFDVDGMNVRSLTVADAKKYLCHPGEIVVVKSSGSAENVVSGKAGLVRLSTGKLVFGNFLMRLRPLPASNSNFLFYFLTSRITIERVKRMVSVTTYPNLRVGEYVNAGIPFPSTIEQQEIVDYLDRETLKVDKLSAKARQMIDVLKQRRQALISAAVTGKIDVRGLT